MTLQRIREICLALPGATEQIQWGNDLVFKIGGKMFCVACTEPVAPPKVAMSFKCDDETFAELVRARRRDSGAVPGASQVGGARAVRHAATPSNCETLIVARLRDCAGEVAEPEGRRRTNR